MVPRSIEAVKNYLEEEAWECRGMKGCLDFCEKEAVSFLCRFGVEYLRVFQTPSISEALDHTFHSVLGESEGVDWPLSLLRGNRALPGHAG